ncbi:MAG: hypothetical protein AAB329_07265, partial [Pseudomonadota bacterium]
WDLLFMAMAKQQLGEAAAAKDLLEESRRLLVGTDDEELQGCLREQRRWFQNLPPEKRQELRERWKNMTPADRQAFREQLQNARPGTPPRTNRLPMRPRNQR